MARQRDSVLTADVLLDYLVVSKSTLRKLSQKGNMPALKVSRHWRFHRGIIGRRLG